MPSEITRLQSFDNASLQWIAASGQTLLDLIETKYPSLPHSCMRNVIAEVNSIKYGLIVFKWNDNYGKIVMLNNYDTGVTVYRLNAGTWSYRTI